MSSTSMSRLFGIGAIAAQGVMPLLAATTYIFIFAASGDSPPTDMSRPDWVLTLIVGLNIAVHLLAVTGVLGMYWVPRLVFVQRFDGYRMRPVGRGMLAYLGLFPPAAAAIGLAWQQGNVPGWYFLLGGASWALVVPALVDVLLRGRRDADSAAEPVPHQLGSGPVGDLLPVGDFDLSLPRRWLWLPQESAPEWAQEGAARLSGDPKRRDKLAQELEKVAPELTAGAHLMAGVWVPGATSPKVAGMVTVDRIVPPEGQRVDREHYRALIEPDHRKKVTVFGRYIDEVEVPAGPVLLVTEVVGQPRSRWRPWDKMIGQNSIFTVFPPGCSEALQLAFSTSVVELQDALQADAGATLETLTVTLEEVRRREFQTRKRRVGARGGRADGAARAVVSDSAALDAEPEAVDQLSSKRQNRQRPEAIEEEPLVPEPDAEGRIVFDEVQIGRRFWPLAQHGFVVVTPQTLSLLGSDEQLIDSAPINSVTAKMIRLTHGKGVVVTLNGTKYSVAPGWGAQVGSLIHLWDTEDVKTAAGYLLHLINNGGRP